MMAVMKNNWWMLLIRGLAAILLGIAVIITPGIALTLLILFWGAYVLVDGIFSLMAGLRGRQENLEIITAIQLRREIKGEFWLGLGGVLSILFGIALIVAPGAGILSPLWLLAFYAMMFGVMMSVLGFRLRNMPGQDSQRQARQMA